jgi:peptidoglycan/LPS O-acetylase OafA/YrhL
MVFSQHYLKFPWGWVGVDVFFVLSGFLITGILFDSRDDASPIRNFYVRRTLRIFPLYYGVALLLVLCYPMFRWQWSWSWLLWLAYLGNFIRGQHVYVDGSPLKLLADAQLMSRTVPWVELHFGHFWSLCVEEQFYLFWPWVVFWVRGRTRLLWICAACVVACPVLRMLAHHALPQFMLDQEVLYRYTPLRIDALLLGGAIALVRRGPSAGRLPAAARLCFAAVLSGGLFWCALALITGHTHRGYGYPYWRFTWGLSLIDLFAACVLVMALESRSVTCRILSLRPLRWLGRISYGAYVFHDVLAAEWVRLAAPHFSHPKWPVAALGLASTLLLAWASLRWFEGPFIRLKQRWASSANEESSRRTQSEVVPLVDRAAGLSSA